MSNVGLGEFMIYTLISVVSLFSLLLFVPHTLLSSSGDTPLIFYRYLMILAGLLLFLYNIIINFNGISDDVRRDIKTLCNFIDWIYILIVIPLVIPFINNIIKAAQTASQISTFKFNRTKLSLVPQNSDKDHKLKDKNTNKCSKIFITLFTFLTWLSAIICQILTWYNNDSFYEEILFQHIISLYICCTCLFVAVSFIVLYREINKVQQAFIRVQTQFKKRTHSSFNSQQPQTNPKHKNDNSVSIYNDNCVPQAVIEKNAEVNQEVIQSLQKHKNKCVKITTFVMILAALSIYSTFSHYEQEQSMLNIAYSNHPLFDQPYQYVIFVLSRLVFTSIMYLWLAINNLYKKKAPKDSIAYIIYNNCCCQFSFCCCCLYCSCIDLLFNHNNENNKPQIEIEMEHIPKITEFKDDINYVKKQQNEPSHSNKTLPNSMPHMQATSTDEYADIDNITMFKPNNNYNNEYDDIDIDNNLNKNTLPKMAIHIIKSSKENNFEPENDMNNDSNRSSMDTKTKSKHLHSGHNSIHTMTLPYNMSNSPGSKTTTAIGSVGNEEFSALPTYKEEFHRDNGLMENEANFPPFVGSLGSFNGDSIDNMNGSEFFSPSPNSFQFPNILRKTTDTIANIPNMRINSANNSDIIQVESDSDDIDHKMIVGVKVIVYAFDILLSKLDTICHENFDKYETKIKRLLQHFLIMNDNISNVFIVSNRMKTQDMIDTLEMIHLKNSFIGNKMGDVDDMSDMYNVIGYDHKWIKHCNKNVKLMLLGLIQKLKIENDEVLVVGNRTLMQYIETINICQIYNVDAIQMDKNNQKEPIDGTLQGRHLMFLESQVLASI
eukprot:238695_1